MISPGSPAARIPYGTDRIGRKIYDLGVEVQQQAAARGLERSTIGSGGTLTVEGTLAITGDLQVPTGALSSAGAMTAGTDVVAGNDVSAGRDVTAIRNVHAGNDLNADGDLNVRHANLSGSVYSPTGRATPVTTSYVAAYFNSDGRLGATPSSLRFKQDVQAADTTALVEAILHFALVRFRYIAAVEEHGEDARLELGSLAEYAVHAGLSEFVYLDEEGLPLGINYERLTLPLIATVQSLDARLRAAGL
jgi:hypothetical protein